MADISNIEDLNFIEYLDYLKDISNVNTHEYEDTKSAILTKCKDVYNSLNATSIDNFIKKKCLKTVECFYTEIQKVFELIDDARKSQDLEETFEETFDKDLFVAKIQYHLEYAQKNVNSIKKIISSL